MTLLDRILVSLARLLMRALNRRFNPERGRVWFWQIVSARPKADTWDGGQRAARVALGFGGSEASAIGARHDRAIVSSIFTREMFDVMVSGANLVHEQQTAQLAILRQEGHDL